MKSHYLVVMTVACLLHATGCAGFGGGSGPVGRSDTTTLQRELKQLNDDLHEARQKDADRVSKIAEAASLIQELRAERERSERMIRDLDKRVDVLQRTLDSVLKRDISQLDG